MTRGTLLSRLLLLGSLLLTSACASSCDLLRSARAAPLQGAVFLTFMDEDTGRTMSVRYVSPTALSRPSLEVKRASGDDEKALSSTLTHREVQGRHLYAFDLAGLTPATRYTFTVKEGERALTKERAFTTLPDDDRPLLLAQGGDVGIDAMARTMLAAAAKQSPDLLALGGDLAYGNGEPAAAPRWDVFLTNLDELLVTPDGRTIPVVFAIGNHEVRGSFLQPPSHAPFWYGYLSDVRDTDRMDETSFVRSLGASASLVVLDSAHIQPHAAQRRFLDEALARTRARPFSFALYHVPLFPSVRDFSKQPADQGRLHWMPLFDEHDLTVAFENHDHARKRTPPLEAGVPAAGGTLYLGDGCMGQSERPVLQRGAPYLASAATGSHFWLAEITSGGVRFRAVDKDGRTIDETTAGPRALKAPSP